MTHKDETRIREEFRDAIAQNPDHADDPAWLISAVAFSLGHDERDVRKVWREHFDIPGAC